MKTVTALLMALFTVLLTARVRAVPPAGLLILSNLNGKSEAAEFSTVLEYRRFQSFGATWKVMMPDNTEHSGPSAHIVHNFRYDARPTKARLVAMQVASEKYRQATAPLKPRIAALEARLLELSKLPPAEPEVETISSFEYNGVVYEKVYPETVRDGRLTFRHSAGLFSSPSNIWPANCLELLGRMNPALDKIEEFKLLQQTFAPVILVAGKVYHGARIVNENAKELLLLTDEGHVHLKPDDVSEDVRKRLTIAAANERKMEARIEARLREKAEAAERIRKELARAAEARAKAREEKEKKDLYAYGPLALVVLAALNGYDGFHAPAAYDSGLAEDQGIYRERQQQYWTREQNEEDRRRNEEANEEALRRQSEEREQFYQEQARQREQEFQDRAAREREAQFDNR